MLLLPNLSIIPAHANVSACSPTCLAVFLLAVPGANYLARRPRGRTTKVPVWDGGIVSFRARMQYTGATFANPMRVTFDRLHRPDVKVDRASEDPAGSSGPVHYRLEVLPVFERFLYQPVLRLVRRLARVLEPIQPGDVNWHLLVAVVGCDLAAVH